MRNYFLKFLLFLFVTIPALAQSQAYDEYLDPAGLNKALSSLNKKYPKNTKLISLARSAGGQDLQMIEIGHETGTVKKSKPAVLVVANMEGIVPVSSMAAIYLADYLLENSSAYDNLSWYILPCGNPDAYSHYFEFPLKMDPRNSKAHNDDMDNLTDEDGFEDLNKDGFITQMRVKDPMGTWVPVKGEPRLLRKADASKGEKGIYKLYSEGLDNDGDGKYNEDGKGGVNVGINFPHLFKPFQKTSGLWPGCTDESFQLMKFVFEHPEIAMTMDYGAVNFCIQPPKGGRKGSVDMDKIKIPKGMAEDFGADPNKTYSMKEIIELVQPLVPQGMTVTESMVASFLGLGAVVNPLDKDLKFYKDLSEKYKEYLKDKGLKAERLAPEKAKDASFELWSYYQLGIPSFAMDFWTLPKLKEESKEKSEITVDKLKEMSSEEFVALGKEKIAVFLKESGAPEQFTADVVIKMVEGGKMTPAKMAEMMKDMPKKEDDKGGDSKTKALIAYSDEHMQGKGFVDWTAYKHPVLGDVEIGGVVPYVDNTPPASLMDSLFALQVPWTVELSKKLARLKILDHKLEYKGGGVYELTLWIENISDLPFPTAMGERNEQPAPAIVEIEGSQISLLSGKSRTPVNSLGAHKIKEISWLIESEKATDLTLKLSSVFAWGDQEQIKIGGAK